MRKFAHLPMLERRSVEKLLLSPEEAGAALGQGRTSVYLLMSTGQLESVRIGRSRRISAAVLESYVASLRAATAVSR